MRIFISYASEQRQLAEREDSGVQLRLDSNPRHLHHDVFVIDDETVITGSLNFSLAALRKNDENVVFIPDATLARKYSAEFSGLWTTATPPDPQCTSPNEPDTGG